MPERIQLRRTAGWRKPDGAIVVARPSKWGNPWRITDLGNQTDPHRPRYQIRHVDRDESLGTLGDWEIARSMAVSQFKCDLEAGRLAFTADDVRRELYGRDLACWCPPTPLNPNGSPKWPGWLCHGDILLDWATTGEQE